ncbi:hypothetical protein PC9H_001535 [Pleurotus ostreatus]|uniref:Glyoxalase-like domain-containing protein n=1 Tax=Pleurotus ostreatus TaxID=5322 RepID=A0A8H7E0C8_PLEOS|nr:uncharacterized protein PC9H_001535 [Pleurotus ostreatus]KAF7441186.1 hypothetical protein PC9H_001535 [Pleurotus ostreatus]
MTSPSTNTLDHIVHLSHPGALDETISRFRELGFNVIPGGTHADGLTSNALVIFEDGTYLELLNFVKPAASYPAGSPERAKRDSHPWAPKNPGWIDFAFLGTGEDKHSGGTGVISEIINARSKDVRYLGEVAGGRETPAGKILKWLITSPAKQHGRGVLPFFCGDVTPREWRVPVTQENTAHPNTARGVAYIVLLVSSDNLALLSRQVTTIIGAPANHVDDELSWSLETIRSTRPAGHLRLRSPKTEEEQSFLDSNIDANVGIYEVGIWVDAGKSKEPASLPHTRIVWQSIIN